MKNARNKAAISNPALKAFETLVGKWKTAGTHPPVPGTFLHGHTSFEWTEGGAFLVMHSNLLRQIPRHYCNFWKRQFTRKVFYAFF